MTYNHYSYKPNFLLRNNIAQTIIGSIFFGNTDLPERKIHKVQVDKNARLIRKREIVEDLFKGCDV